MILRYRTGYSVEPPRQKVTSSQVQSLVEAINRPVNATAIALIASPTRSGSLLNLALLIDVSALDLEQKKGAIEKASRNLLRAFWEVTRSLPAR